MSLLTLDISNSHTTFGIFEGDKLTAHWRVKSDEHRTSDEWYLVLQGLITRTTLAEVEAVLFDVQQGPKGLQAANFKKAG